MINYRKMVFALIQTRKMLNYFILFRKSICQYWWLSLFAGNAETQPCFSTCGWAQEWNRLCVRMHCLVVNTSPQPALHRFKHFPTPLLLPWACILPAPFGLVTSLFPLCFYFILLTLQESHGEVWDSAVLVNNFNVIAFALMPRITSVSVQWGSIFVPNLVLCLTSSSKICSFLWDSVSLSLLILGQRLHRPMKVSAWSHMHFTSPFSPTDTGFPRSSGGWSCDRWWRSWPSTRPATMCQTQASWNTWPCSQRRLRLEPSKRTTFRLLS